MSLLELVFEIPALVVETVISDTSFDDEQAEDTGKDEQSR